MQCVWRDTAADTGTGQTARNGFSPCLGRRRAAQTASSDAMPATPPLNSRQPSTRTIPAHHQNAPPLPTTTPTAIPQTAPLRPTTPKIASFRPTAAANPHAASFRPIAAANPHAASFRSTTPKKGVIPAVFNSEAGQAGIHSTTTVNITAAAMPQPEYRPHMTTPNHRHQLSPQPPAH